LHRLEQQLDDAANFQQYERASRLRDTLDRVQYLWDQLAMLRSRPLPAQCVYPLQLGDGPAWYMIVSGAVVATVAAPTSETAAHECLRQLDRVFAGTTVEKTEVDRPVAQVVSSWFRMHPHEVANVLMPDEALWRCRRQRAG
jgi:hypothetical protein